MSAISGFCEKCNKFRKRHCDGNRNTCMSILFDTIEALQQENQQLRAKLEDWKHEVQCHIDEVIAREKQIEQLKVLKKAREAIQRAKENFEPYGEYEYDVRYDLEEALAEIDKAIGGKEDV